MCFDAQILETILKVIYYWAFHDIDEGQKLNIVKFYLTQCAERIFNEIAKAIDEMFNKIKVHATGTQNIFWMKS